MNLGENKSIKEDKEGSNKNAVVVELEVVIFQHSLPKTASQFYRAFRFSIQFYRVRRCSIVLTDSG